MRPRPRGALARGLAGVGFGLSSTSAAGFVETVRSAADIVQLVSEYVPLRRSGRRYVGLCPFHEEKTPSFSVDPERQLFYCFGCQTGGDVFKFVQLYEKVDFREALEQLARKWRVPVPRGRERPDPRARLLEVNQAAEAFFRRCLGDERLGRACREYLERRTVPGAVVAKLGLGYAPPGWEELRRYLLGRGFGAEELLRAGLTIRRREGSGEYDRFRHRLIFPIRDLGGRVVAFGGRALGDEEPKYANSPETALYVKGDHLYGLDLARGAIRAAGFAIVVEGYLDLAALLGAGFDNAVASLGTALTPAQVQLLARFTQRVVVSYDGDAAGGAAAVRSLDLLLARGFEVRVVELPPGKDPDDLIREQGGAAYGRRVEAAPTYLEFLVRRQARMRDLSQPRERVAALNEVLPHVARLPSAVERAAMVGTLAETFRVDDEIVLQELRACLRAGRPALRHVVRPEPPLRQVEARLVSLLLRFEGARQWAQEEMTPADLEGTQVRGIVETLLRLQSQGSPVDYPTLFGALQDEGDRALLTRIAFRDEPEGTSDEVGDCLRQLRRQRLLRERRRVQAEIEAAADPAAVDALLQHAQRLARQIDRLSQPADRGAAARCEGNGR